MTAQELLRLASDFENYYLNSDVNSSVIFGCDCGCGGDLYSYEDWTQMCKLAEECYDKYKEVCEELNIEWDYD